MSRVLVTGANGFVGKALCARLVSSEHRLRCAIRTETIALESIDPPLDAVCVGDIGPETDWEKALENIDVVIHLAARVHVMDETETDPLSVFRLVNTAGTERLACSAVKQGVKRFVFLSTVKVNGEETQGQPFTEDDQPSPQDPYAVSKWEAEKCLRKLAEGSDMDVVIIRPPLIYGPGVKGNFSSLLHWVGKGIPFPLGAIHNQRSLLALDNLVDFIMNCLDHPAAGNQTFLLADNETLSTTDLLRRIGLAIKKPARLLPVPAKILELMASFFGKQNLSQRLLGSLQIDNGKAWELLGWKPPITIDEGLQRYYAETPVVGRTIDYKLIRLFDIALSLFGLVVGTPLLLLLTIIGILDTGSPIFRQKRVGLQQKPFVLVKFRTMKLDTASVASHLASFSSITKFGHFLRRTKLDELPQLWNVLIGEMSLVGPRPCLFNQEELIHERDKRGAYSVRPGITGLAQVNGIDISTPKLLAETDARMIEQLTLRKYFSYILQTVIGKGAGDRVKD